MPWLIEWRHFVPLTLLLRCSYSVKALLGPFGHRPGVVREQRWHCYHSSIIMDACEVVLYTYLIAACYVAAALDERVTLAWWWGYWGDLAGLHSTSTGWVWIALLHAHHVRAQRVPCGVVVVVQ